MLPSARLREAGLELPPVAAPVASYVPATVVGSQVWTSGQLPIADGQVLATGLVGQDLDVEQAAEAARRAALNAIAAAADAAGDLDRIARVLKVVVYVASAPGFTDQPLVANGASRAMTEVFGEAGVHVRSAVGVAVLPLGACVEVELLAELG